MSKLEYAVASDLRRAIEMKRVVRFVCLGQQYEVEPHLLGNAIRTRTIILTAWVRAPEPGWRTFRFSLIRALEFSKETFPCARPGFNPHDPHVDSIDTIVK
jgi:hypothetical protein